MKKKRGDKREAPQPQWPPPTNEIKKKSIPSCRESVIVFILFILMLVVLYLLETSIRSPQAQVLPPETTTYLITGGLGQ